MALSAEILARLPGESLLGPGSKLRHSYVELPLERHHHVAGVLREALDSVERRHDEALGSRKHSDDSEHSGAPVIKLYVEATLLILRSVLLEEVERIVEVEEELGALADERWVVAWDATRLGVVRHLAGDLAVRLEHAHEGEDLEVADSLLVGESPERHLGAAKRIPH